MKEVYVLHGRIHWNESVSDHDGNYFEESPCVEVFDNFDAAKTKLKELAIEAYNYLKEVGAGYVVDDSFVNKTTAEDLFSDYNIWLEDDFDEDELDELKNNNDKKVMWEEITNDVAWQYEEWDEYIRWQMYRINCDAFDTTEPILPGLRIRKCVVNA